MTKLLSTLLLLSMTCAPVGAQGVSEMGGVYAIPKGGMGGFGGAVKGLFNGAGNAINRSVSGSGSSSGGQHSGVVGGASPARRLAPEQIASYTSQAQHAYAAALAAQKAGKSAEAIKQFGIAISVRENVWGLGDPNIAEIARKQAELLTAAGRKDEAETAWRKVLASDQRHYGAGARELVPTLTTLASLAEARGDSHETLNYYKQLFAIQNRLGADSKSSRMKVATLSMGTGDFTTAESLLKEALTSEESSASPDKAYEAQLYDAYASVLRSTNRATDAAAVESKAAALRETSP
jgi:tetratricopeptide (TPR) repeat protein